MEAQQQTSGTTQRTAVFSTRENLDYRKNVESKKKKNCRICKWIRNLRGKYKCMVSEKQNDGNVQHQYDYSSVPAVLKVHRQTGSSIIPILEVLLQQFLYSRRTQ